MEYETDLLDILAHIDPSVLSYQEWISIGMGLKEAGYAVRIWDDWSGRDTTRYHRGECERKWETFHGATQCITAGTIVQIAREHGWCTDSGGRELAWDEVIDTPNEHVVVNKNWIEAREVQTPEHWDPTAQLVTYLETLFESTENVGYVTDSWEKDGKYMPSRGAYDRTAGELIQELNRCNGDIGAVLGDYNPAVGAWIRFNPLDGKGIKNENVTDYRYALVESDAMAIEQQNALIRELELPVACLVHSGKKSLHAIVRIDAATFEEYRKRVDYLYDVCQKNGLAIDRQNRNPSRLSRMPGVMRAEQKQFLADVNIGKACWNEWHEWIESVNDDLPDPESMAETWDNLPPLSPPLIDGVLRQGHKLLLAGPSKAGKSYSLIQLCCAIAEGRRWLGFPCTRGRVLYVNLELDRASCLHRFRDVYDTLGWATMGLANIDVWNLRGRSVPMDKLAPKLIRRATKKQYIAIVIDPIYKVITGDENSADQMAHFCNQFDKVCTELGCAVIYCHHHSKGSQGSKRSMDRASGSGVFARDPDALLDLIELEVKDDLRKQAQNTATCEVCAAWLRKKGLEDEASQDDSCSRRALLDLCKAQFEKSEYNALLVDLRQSEAASGTYSAWRVEGTLREFPKFAPVNMWFTYPVHRVDTGGVLADCTPDGETPTWKKNFPKKKTAQEMKEDRKVSVQMAFDACNLDEGGVTVTNLSEYLGVSEKTARTRIKEHGGFWVDGDEIGVKSGAQK